MEIIHEGRESKKCLGVMSYSPDGTLLVIGSHDHLVYLHTASDGYKCFAKCDKSTGNITHFDFSTDGGFLRVNSDTFELFFINTVDGSWVPSPATVKDVAWATQSCTLAWPVSGIWSSLDENYIVHSCSDAKNTSAVAVGDNAAQVRIYNYPILSKEAPNIILHGHAHEVSNVAFTAQDTHLITTGLQDRTIMTFEILKK